MLQLMLLLYGTLGCIRFYSANVENVRNPVKDLSYGGVVKVTVDTVEVIVHERMISELIQKFLLAPLHTVSFPTDALSCTEEVIAVEQ